MTTMMPYDRYNRSLRSWPFEALDHFFDTGSLYQGAQHAGFKMNVEDAGDTYIVTAELPGVDRSQIDVELNEGRLSISVNHTESEEDKAKNYLYKETTDWSATRGVYLKDAATSGLSAKLDMGILSVFIPKQDEKVNVTKISID